MSYGFSEINNSQTSVVLQKQAGLLTALVDRENIKPFVALNLCSATNGIGSELESVSGQAIITYVISGEGQYRDSTGKSGCLKKDDWAWIISGSGILHAIKPTTDDYLAIQVSIALSPALENSLPQSSYIEASARNKNDPAQVLIGRNGINRGTFAAPSLVNLLIVHLDVQQQWTYELPLNHQFAWASVISGSVKINGEKKSQNKIDTYHTPAEKIQCRALSESILVIGSAHEFDYDLVAQNTSVHTSIESLQQGLRGVAQIKMLQHL
ncbi:pirin family protein [Cellvibrio sp. NN19]|uniref:pirin family protein n=1 Tax=Cellvibrio chitinivorans TaxID=3102792 RepID=UPI002B40F154|nr:pirin family protein [Cellvibrio sp. NN19]